jgi:hypothetical protein
VEIKKSKIKFTKYIILVSKIEIKTLLLPAGQTKESKTYVTSSFIVIKALLGT